MKLGCLAKHADPRTLQYAAARASADFDAPASYSWDKEHPGAVTLPMFLNDQLGDCVIAGRAHQTKRFEFLEQGRDLLVSDMEVQTEYFAESGGQDRGLVVLYSLRDWRNKGWVAAGSRYFIHSFLEVQIQNRPLLKEAMLVGTGLGVGVRLPLSASDQRNARQPWDVASGPRSEAGSWGGHYMWCGAYDDEGVEFVTWGSKQRATWRWLETYADECYLVVDDVDRVGFSADHNLDTDKVEDALDAIKA